MGFAISAFRVNPKGVEIHEGTQFVDSGAGDAIKQWHKGYFPHASQATVRTRGRHDDHVVFKVQTHDGHELAEHEVQSLLNGENEDNIRRQAISRIDGTKQATFENTIRTHMRRHGKLPHSGVDAMLAGVPTASSPLGVHISGGFDEKGMQKPGYQFPHHSGDMTRRNSGLQRGISEAKPDA